MDLENQLRKQFHQITYDSRRNPLSHPTQQNMINVKTPMRNWDINETQEHICRLFNEKQLALARTCLRSVSDRQIYAQIHFRDAKAKIDSYNQMILQDTSLFEVMSNSEAWDKFNFFMREVGAHFTACVQSIHAIPDILANALYYSLGFNCSANTSLESHEVCTKSVLKLLEQETRFDTISAHLKSLVKDRDFTHLAALANRAKHQSIVVPEMNEDLTSTRGERLKVTFPAFSHNKKLYSQVFADDFLAAEYKRSSQCIVNIGIELNIVLQCYVP